MQFSIHNFFEIACCRIKTHTHNPINRVEPKEKNTFLTAIKKDFLRLRSPKHGFHERVHQKKFTPENIR